MFVCAGCLKGRCDEDHVTKEFGRCEICHQEKETSDCCAWRTTHTPFTLEQAQLAMLEHLEGLAKISYINPRDISIAAQVACAKDMCKLAGISEGAVQDALLEAKLK